MASQRKLQNIFKGDRCIWVIFFLLCVVSVTEVYSSSSLLGYKSGNYWFAAVYHTGLLFVGLILMVIVLNIPIRFFKVLIPIMSIVSVIGLVLVYIIGTASNDASRWISIGGIALQPSELAKGTMVFLTAMILSDNQTEDGANPKAVKYIGIASVFLILPILPENFSTAALLAAVVFMMMIIGRVPAKYLLSIFFGAIGIVALVVMMVLWLGEVQQPAVAEDGRQLTEEIASNNIAAMKSRGGILHRFDSWKGRIERFTDNERVDPKDYDLDKNGQVGYANIAIAKSNFIGLGPGNSEQRDFLPLAFSDFIYAIIFEELGWLGALFVAFLYITLLFRAGTIARRCKYSFPAYMAMGAALLLVTQAVFNMMVAVGLVPVTGQPLPLISKGGTSSIINCMYIGVILSVSRTATLRDELVEEKTE